MIYYDMIWYDLILYVFHASKTREHHGSKEMILRGGEALLEKRMHAAAKEKRRSVATRVTGTIPSDAWLAHAV